MAHQGTEGRGLPAESRSEAERRGAARHLADLRITCYPAGAGAGGRTVRVRNISRTGIGLLIDRFWAPGTALSISLPLNEEGRLRSCQARVVHATALPGGCFLLGCSFETSLTDHDLQVLLAGPPPASGPAYG